MENRINKIILGIILLILGVASLFQNYININFGSLTVFFIGMALLMLYKTKRKSWALILGTYLTFFGIINVLGALNINTELILAVCLFFILPGVVFLVLFFEKNKLGLLYPGSFLLWFGISIFLNRINPNIWQTVFLLCTGLTFLTIFLLGKEIVSPVFGIFGIAFILIGILRLISKKLFTNNLNSFSLVFSVIIIIFALKLIFGKNKMK